MEEDSLLLEHLPMDQESLSICGLQLDVTDSAVQWRRDMVVDFAVR